MSFILTLDQGTTSSRAILFDHGGNPVAMAQQEFSQIFPHPGWVEHDPMEIWASQEAVAREVLRTAGIRAADLAAIGITNQRETTLVWDRRTGQPLYNAIVWQDRRTADICEQLRRQGAEELFRDKTGLVLDPYFSGTKVKWILDHIPDARARARRGELAFGTVDSWLIWQITGGKKHLTDVSNAARTLLFNIHSGEWDEDLLTLLDIPRELLPEVRSSSEVYCHSRPDFLDGAVPVSGIAGDQQAALFGQICHRPGMVKNTYGTGCFMVMFTGEQAITSRNNLLTTIAWERDGRKTFALEGSVFVAGAVVQWLRDGLGIIRSSGEIEALAAGVDNSDGVFFVPAFTGLGAPYWDPHARGTITGMTRGTTRAHIARAALDSIAHQTVDVLKAMEADAGMAISELRTDGGATVNNLLMQIQADLLDVPVICPRVSETTALGAAYLAGLGCGFWKNTEQIGEQWQVARRFEPVRSRDEVARQREQWRRAVERSRSWAE
ncbi:MAG TPA: glycerol kinase GlpK [Calditrichia bacterium]|nr:glycerol kinase GlpK [Calditrichia bacterium]